MHMRQMFTNSETSCFQQCQKKWYFCYHQLLRPKIRNWHLRFGSAFHAAMAVGYSIFLDKSLQALGESDYTNYIVDKARKGGQDELTGQYSDIIRKRVLDWSEEERIEKESEESRALLDSIVKLYFWVNRRDQHVWVPMLVEQPFRVPLLDANYNETGFYHLGVFDLVVYDLEWEAIVLVEFKTTSSDTSTVSRRFDFDPQMCGYLYALKYLLGTGKLLHPITGEKLTTSAGIGKISYNVCRKKIPSIPKMKKDGMVSVAAIDTLPSVYEDALKQQVRRGLEITTRQKVVLEGLRNRGFSSFFRRYEHYYSTGDLLTWAKEQRINCSNMAEMAENPSQAVRSPIACTMASSPRCAYRPICVDDTPEIRSAFYDASNKRHEEIDDMKGILR